MNLSEKPIDRRLCFQFTHDTGEGRPVMVNFGLFHPSLAICIVEELKHLSKGLFGVIHDIGESSALGVLKKGLA